jgi:hypothetical protein
MSTPTERWNAIHSDEEIAAHDEEVRITRSWMKVLTEIRHSDENAFGIAVSKAEAWIRKHPDEYEKVGTLINTLNSHGIRLISLMGLQYPPIYVGLRAPAIADALQHVSEVWETSTLEETSAKVR